LHDKASKRAVTDRTYSCADAFGDSLMINYFNYFTEVERFYQTKRKSFTLLSTLDWVLVETWKESGIPLETVLRGIDRAFSRAKREVNSLAYCMGAVAEVAEEEKEGRIETPKTPEFSSEETKKYLDDLAAKVDGVAKVFPEFAAKIGGIAQSVRSTDAAEFEKAEQELVALEEKLIAILKIASDENALLQVKRSVDGDLNPFRSTMTTEQLSMLEQQLWRRKLMEKYDVPRLSLFYLI
jgi:hypothetical protein